MRVHALANDIRSRAITRAARKQRQIDKLAEVLADMMRDLYGVPIAVKVDPAIHCVFIIETTVRDDVICRSGLREAV